MVQGNDFKDFEKFTRFTKFLQILDSPTIHKEACGLTYSIQKDHTLSESNKKNLAFF